MAKISDVFKKKNKTIEKTAHLDWEKLTELMNYIWQLERKQEKIQNSTFVEDVVRPAYSRAIELFGHNKAPVVVKDEDFRKLDGPILYRGVKKIEHHAMYLCDEDYYKGSGIVEGIYFSDEFGTALQYAKGDANAVLKVKLMPDAKIIYCRNLEDAYFGRVSWFRRHKNNIDDETQAKIHELKLFLSTLDKKDAKTISCVILQTCILGVILGYDAVTNIGWGEHYVLSQTSVANRGKLVVSESEFKRICSQSPEHKNRVKTMFQTGNEHTRELL